MSIEDASKVVAEKYRNEWIKEMSIYPMRKVFPKRLKMTLIRFVSTISNRTMKNLKKQVNG